MTHMLVCLAAALVGAAPVAPSNPARDVVRRAIDALGGEAALKGIASLEIESIGHAYYIEQSERPQGPFIVRYTSSTETRDVAGGRSRTQEQQRDVLSPEWAGGGAATIIDTDAAAASRNGRLVAASRQVFEKGRELIDLAPERLLFTALEASDLTLAPRVTVHGIPQDVVSFTWRGRRARLLVDGYDAVPTALELRTDDPFGIWGIVETTTYYSLWTLVPGGVRFPLQTDRTWNGVTESSATITKIAVNRPVDTGAFVVSDEVKRSFAAQPAIAGVAALTFDAARAVELAPGIVQFQGAWNVAVVRQPDGVVVIEAPIGSGYSSAVLSEVHRRFPDLRVKAVVTTSDAWPHLGGVREYVARGIPVYALDLNRPILERLLNADYSARPDALAGTRKPPKFTWVSGRTAIGSGDTRIEIYPARGENGERMLFAYLPAQKLLYSSDDIQRDRSGAFFMPEYLFEVRDAARRHGLVVDRIFGMHIGPTPWSAIEAAIAAAATPVSSAPSSPRGD